MDGRQRIPDLIVRLLVQRLSAAGYSAGLSYFGQSLHGVLDVNGDGLVDLAVGALGAAVIIWLVHLSRIQAHVFMLSWAAFRTGQSGRPVTVTMK